MKLKQERTTAIEVSLSTDQPPYAEIQTKAPPHVPNMLEDFNSPLNIGYSEIQLEPDGSKHALPAKPPRHVSILTFNFQSNRPQPYVSEHEPTP